MDPMQALQWYNFVIPRQAQPESSSDNQNNNRSKLQASGGECNYRTCQNIMFSRSVFNRADGKLFKQEFLKSTKQTTMPYFNL